MESMDIYWLWLSSIKGAGPITAKVLLNKFETPYKIYKAEREEILDTNGVGKHILNKIAGARSLDTAEKIMKDCIRNDIKLLPHCSELYPEDVKQLKKSPVVLYYKGTLIHNSIGVGITGSRICSEYAKRVAVEAAEFLALNRIPVISGMGGGVDSLAITACLNKNGYAVAVLPNGIDVCYPREHAKLRSKIIEKGALVSQFPPGTEASKYNFPKRSYLFSGWCRKMLIAEAGEKCGSLTAADHAREQVREVFAAPSSIYSMDGIGSNSLIKGGCKIYLSPSQLAMGEYSAIINEPDDNKAEELYNPARGDLQKRILGLLQDTPKTMEELVAALEGDKSIVFNTIASLEIEGKLKTVAGCRLIATH
jgi:DNA processing protein